MIVFVRHGETVPNRAGLLLGRSDPVLTERGREQSAALAATIARLRPGSVVSSPLGRTYETASIIAAECGLDVEIDQRLIEIDYGDWEGKPLTELAVDAATRWRADADFAPPGGESLHAVGRRVRSFCEERLDEHTVVAVSHVSPIKAAVCWTFDVGDEVAWRMRLDVASMTRIGVTPAGPVLLGLNETPAAVAGS